MLKVFVDSHNLISPLGNNSSDNFEQLKRGRSGIQLHRRPDIDDSDFWASIISDEQLRPITSEIKNSEKYTRFEKLLIASISDALKKSEVDTENAKTIFIFSTTKGNISLLEQQSGSPGISEKSSLYYSGKMVAAYFKNPNNPVIISNACVSGLAAIVYARRLLESGQYNYAIVAGADELSRFVFSGFKSFLALSQGVCKPFSTNRDGINLGEASAVMILTSKPEQLRNDIKIQVSGGALFNDSNHISGPSKTGQELSAAIDKALKASNITASDVDFISAHGTATLYNDEMEAKAFNLSHLQYVPVNSLKGYFGHTLGAAGLVESIISIESLKEGVILSTGGFSEDGIKPVINVCRENIKKNMKHCLKTASGFGGCNGALVFSIQE